MYCTDCSWRKGETRLQLSFIKEDENRAVARQVRLAYGVRLLFSLVFVRPYACPCLNRMIASTLCSRTGFLYYSSDMKFYSRCSLPALQMQLHTWTRIIHTLHMYVQSTVQSDAWCILRVLIFPIRLFFVERSECLGCTAYKVRQRQMASYQLQTSGSFVKETSPRKSQNVPL